MTPTRRGRTGRARTMLGEVCLAAMVWAGFGVVVAEAQDRKLMVTVYDGKTGEPIDGLRAANFNIVDDKVRLRVTGAVARTSLVDVMLLVDTSLLGQMVRPLGVAFVNSLGDKEQMAIVSFHDSADLIQDFTASRELLHRALEQVSYGNNPHVLDALYAAIDGGFQGMAGRRVIVLLSSGVEGRSRVSEGEILRLARQRGVSIFPVYVMGAERGMFRRLAAHSGGAYFAAKRLKLDPKPLSERVYSVLRGYYEVSIADAFTLGDRVKATIEGLPKSKRKMRVSILPLE